ncbi:MAG TPA: hypothetical protein VGQ56_11995 [Gemmatimonadaceae bacterium]|nr:hypothetical protein [Gemmatimonadaceae bacterium]
MNDDRIDELLAQGTRDYNEPGPVPRDEMWARIQASRRAAPVVPVRHDTRPSRPIWMWSSVGIAAALILAAGITIGRRVERATPTSVAPVAVTPRVAQPTRDSATAAPATTVANRDSLIGKLREQTTNTNRRAHELANAQDRTTGAPAERNLAYHLVVLQHLAGSEAMITAFRTAARRGEMDAQLATWSRELLSTTRMLESSAATQDPTMKRLLEDLDLVIAQIVQYVTHGTNNSEDLDLIEQSITTRGIITKLRGTASARNSAAGT